MSAAEYLVSWLRFDSAATADKCGETWTAYGSPTISNNALQLNGSSYLKRDSPFKFTGQPFSIGCWFSGTSNTTGGSTCIWQLWNQDRNRIQLDLATNGKLSLWKDSDSTVYILTSASVLDGQMHYAECAYANSTWYLFLDGQRIGTANHTPNNKTYTLYLGTNNYATNRKFTGTIEEFQIYDGVALHTENFTPPTVADYDALATEFDALGEHVVIRFDAERNVKKTINITADFERKIKNAPLAWQYYNAGDVHDLTQTPTYLTDLPATKSTTGYAFYQTTRAKCFDLPATPQIWAKFDVYFDGSNRWRAYNGGSNGDSGVSVESGNFCFFVNRGTSYHKQFTNVQKTNQLQTVLLHMVSGTNGLIEAWVDGTKIYTFNGDVNHGDDFADFYLQSDGAGTFFSNVTISNSQIGLDYKYAVALNISNSLVNPPDAPHFHFSGTQYAQLPTMLGGATTFTFEIKFATTSTVNNSYWAEMPSLIGQSPQLYYDNLFVYVNDSRLGFYAKNPDNAACWYTPYVLRGVNDGNVHKMTFSVDAGTIKLICDGYTCQFTLANLKIRDIPLFLAWNCYNVQSHLTCDIYEARIWSVARADWEEIDGTEEGLECWLKPTREGLYDYSGNDRHATLYGNPAFIGAEDFEFAIERAVINNVAATAALERRLIKSVETTAAIERILRHEVTTTAAIEREIITRTITAEFAIERRLINPNTLTFDIEQQIVRAEELTFAVERDVTFSGLLTRILPDSILNDTKFKASAIALDMQIIAVFAAVKEVLHIPRLDELTGTILDLLAWQLHVDFYEPLYLTDEQKRALIRQSVAWHRRKGTVAAVEELAATVFKGASIQEWFDYGGEPYYFRIIAKSFAKSAEDYRTFRRAINVAKNVRSHLDKIIVDFSPEEPLKVKVGFGRRAVTGTKRILRDKPKDLRLRIGIGTRRYVIGHIGPILPPAPVEPMRLRISLGFGRLIRTGNIRWRNDHGNTDPLDDDDPLPADYVGSYIWFRWLAATGKRGMRIRNPRDDVTEADLKTFMQYVVDNEVLRNSKGDLLTTALRASVLKTKEEIIPLDTSVHILPKQEEIIF